MVDGRQVHRWTNRARVQRVAEAEEQDDNQGVK
jgi:hypothetical protein